VGATSLGQAAVMFAVTNIDDMVVLAVFFGRTATERTDVLRVVVGQYVGFTAILVLSLLGAFGANLLPKAAIPYLGLLPLLLGIRAAWRLWRPRGEFHDDEHSAGGVAVVEVAAVTFANGGDNIGVYVPVFAVAGINGMLGYAGVFLVGVAIWCVAGWYFASRPAVARLLSRWGHIILPVVLIAIGLVILIDGGAFGL
jgi:cadmium resistance protein CadD (predicted permease)